MKKDRLNKLSTGIIGGIALPFICFFFILVAKKGGYSFVGYLDKIREMSILPRLLSLCLLPNLLLFFLFIWSDRLRSARGVIIAMFVVGIIIIILKFT